MSHKATRRIALLLGQDLGYSRRVLSGVLNYAESHAMNWIFHNAPPDIRVLPALERWRPDAILIHLSDRALGERLLELGVPMVSVTNTIAGLRVPYVDVDSQAVGCMAADYFLGLGFRSFAYYGSRKVEFSKNRERGFRARLEGLGYPVANLHADFLPHSPFGQDWSRVDRQTERWLRQLPKPVAVLASNDIPARVLCELCRTAGLRVPDEVSILGVDNDVSECRMSFPALSSVELPAEQIGREAADALRRMLDGGELTESAQHMSPLGVIPRSSTDYRATGDERVKRVLAYIDEFADRGISVDDVCRRSGLSRRSLERLFREDLHCTVLEQIQKVRVARAKRLLLETDLRIGEVAERAGFGNPRQLNRVFRQYEGEAPSMYRTRGG
ncbi:AraC family transcriptional regulator [Coraliomargarita parva]|uniref:AraC family transcriptional regulator n=1 Tax=Coraliomargarita parva TaxID=3014050 RepID=UPI0022B4B794|nr:DNA-binding transcriptional regulator [Coraliomargarita parva]